MLSKWQLFLRFIFILRNIQFYYHMEKKNIWVTILNAIMAALGALLGGLGGGAL